MKQLIRFIKKRVLAGFTLLELIIVIVILTIISGIITEVIAHVANTALITFKNSGLIAEGRMGFERMVQNIRELRSLPDLKSSTTGEGIQVTTNATSVVSYYLSGGNLMQSNDGNPGQVLVHHASALAVSYFQHDRAVAPAVSAVSTIRVTLTTTKDGQTQIQSTDIFPREIAS